jgi:predicted Fe-Mo cluster-binding NifX family protein
VKIGIAAGVERLSPVFETGERLLVLELHQNHEVNRRELRWPDSSPAARVKFLVDLGVDTLVCGAITRQTEDLLLGAGLEVKPWLCGEVDQIVRALLRGTLSQAEFLMPGCCRHRRQAGDAQRSGGWRRRGRAAWMGKGASSKPNLTPQPLAESLALDLKANPQSQICSEKPNTFYEPKRISA